MTIGKNWASGITKNEEIATPARVTTTSPARKKRTGNMRFEVGGLMTATA